MKKTTLIKRTINLLSCDTARISSPCRKHFMIIGYNRNTKDDEGQWIKNGKPFDFNYIHEITIASGKTLKELWKNVKYYNKLIERDELKTAGERYNDPNAEYITFE